MSAEGQRHRVEDQEDQLQHASIVTSVGAKINGDEFWRGSGVALTWVAAVVEPPVGRQN